MIPEERPDGPGAGEESARLEEAGSGSDPLAQIPRGHPQSRRARVHQQITKELRMRTGAENLYRATSNAWVRETVALELSYVNSSLQLLKEELEELNGSSGPTSECGLHGSGSSEGITVPMIPLGLKETKELDWSTPLKELISGHFGEDSASYEAEIKELGDLRQAIRTPNRSEVGLELLMAYYNQLCFLDARFVAPPGNLGLLFHWYDSLTGLPAQQRALAFEKGSVLFNIGALHTQIGARQDRSCPEGTRRAIEAFQKAAGAFSLLRENFSGAPSPDMSPASLSMLEGLMTAQAQECIFEGLLLPSPEAPQDCLAQLRLAQEAAQVAAEYRQVHRTMTQPPVRDYVPFPWTTLVHVKAEYFCALAHYHAAVALCDSPPAAEEDFPVLPQAFLGPPATSEPWGAVLPQEQEERRNLGKAHLKRSILGQEEALRLHAVCRALRRVDLLQAVLAQALQRSLAKYSELDQEDDFLETAEAPDILPKTQQKPEIRAPSFSRVKVTDIFQRLGPLSVFSAKNHWRLAGPMRVTRGEAGFGLTLRGDAPVLVAAVMPGGPAAAAGLQEGDYIVSLNGQPCKWWRHAEVVARLKGVGDEGVSLQVVTLLPRAEPPGTRGTQSLRDPQLAADRPALVTPRAGQEVLTDPFLSRLQGHRRPALGGLLRIQKEFLAVPPSCLTPSPAAAVQASSVLPARPGPPHSPQSALAGPWVCRGVGARGRTGEKPRGAAGGSGGRVCRESAWPPGGGRCPRQQRLEAAWGAGEGRPQARESAEAHLRAGAPPLLAPASRPLCGGSAVLVPAVPPRCSPQGGLSRGGAEPRTPGRAAFWRRAGLPACPSLGRGRPGSSSGLQEAVLGPPFTPGGAGTDIKWSLTSPGPGPGPSPSPSPCPGGDKPLFQRGKYAMGHRQGPRHLFYKFHEYLGRFRDLRPEPSKPKAAVLPQAGPLLEKLPSAELAP
ncbi:PREDICTED: rhophilin-1 [Odobenus rosmarus divergens]|uniref:Rhophilin-1 n=1 Tax=Odobenus rosmarus divergens TaxID=9708 RepID=A0A9B0GJ84_ODORO